MNPRRCRPSRASLRSALAIAVLGSAAFAQSGWQLRPPVTPRPAARAYHALAYDAANAATVLFGGYGFAGSYLGDTWRWDGTWWMQATTPVAPPPRLAHVMAYDSARARIVLFGGAIGGGNGIDTDDTWEWNGTQWQQQQPVTRPPVRRSACMAFDPVRGVCVLFGGGVGFTGTPLFADTWEWSGTTWTQRAPANVPPARLGACLVADPARAEVLLTGGYFGSALGTPSDTWVWGGTDWQQRFPLTVPPGRMYAGGAYDAQDRIVVTFGGQQMQPGQTFWDTTWVWDGVDWREDPRTPRPGPQMAFALAYDSARDRMVKFGGWWTGIERNLWEYDVGALSTWEATGAGCTGPAGVPELANTQGSHPVAGSLFTLALHYGTGSTVAVIGLGASGQAWLGGSLPFDLTVLGMTGCSLRVSTETLTARVLVSGKTGLDWLIPLTPAAIGFPFFAQALVFDAAANPFGAVMSGAGRGVVGVW